MIKRMVLVRTELPDLVDEVLDNLLALRGTVPCLRDIEVARDTSGRSLGWDRMFVLTFDSAEDIAAWHVHPAHQPVRDVLLRDAELLVFEFDPAAQGRPSSGPPSEGAA